MLPILAVLAACTGNDTNIEAGVPHMDPPPSVIDFGDAQVGRSLTATIKLHDSGIGALEIDASFVGNSQIEVIDEHVTVEPHSDGDLRIAFSPETEGPAEGTLLLSTNDVDFPLVEIPVRGVGVIPTLLASPDTLWFGEVGEGESITRQTVLSSVGSGTVTITDLVFPGDEGAAYTWFLPEGDELPFALPPGHALTLQVVYAPAPDTIVNGELVIASDDHVQQGLPIQLIGGDDGTAEDTPPDVQIVNPPWGTRRLDDELIPVNIYATDVDSQPSDLLVSLYVDGRLAGAGTPDADGWFALQVGPLAGGAQHELKARATDPDGLSGESVVELGVDTHDDLHWTLSGGESVFEYWSVDDDVEVYVDGVSIFSDQNGHQTTHPPLQFNAAEGGTIRIVATDATSCRKLIDDLWLSFGTDRHVQLVEASSASSCAQDADYDANYTGPWPNVFFDETFTLTVP